LTAERGPRTVSRSLSTASTVTLADLFGVLAASWSIVFVNYLQMWEFSRE